MKTILHQIERELEELPRSEKRVGKWILANPSQGVNASVMEVAQATEVSEPTVIRFCRKLGASGFREFKMQLVAALQRPDSFLHHDVEDDDGAVAAANKVLESSIRALVDLRELMSLMPFESAVSAMKSARQLVFVGLGASGHVARDAAHKFFRLGVPCTTALDPQTLLQQAAITGPDDVFISVSHTGQWSEMVKAMSLATRRGAEVIALTDPDAPLAEVASIVFACHPPEDTNVYTPMSSRLAQLTLLDALQVALALELGNEAEKNLRLTKEALVIRRTEGWLE